MSRIVTTSIHSTHISVLWTWRFLILSSALTSWSNLSWRNPGIAFKTLGSSNRCRIPWIALILWGRISIAGVPRGEFTGVRAGYLQERWLFVSQAQETHRSLCDYSPAGGSSKVHLQIVVNLKVSIHSNVCTAESRGKDYSAAHKEKERQYRRLFDLEVTSESSERHDDGASSSSPESCINNTTPSSWSPATAQFLYHNIADRKYLRLVCTSLQSLRRIRQNKMYR